MTALVPVVTIIEAIGLCTNGLARLLYLQVGQRLQQLSLSIERTRVHTPCLFCMGRGAQAAHFRCNM